MWPKFLKNFSPRPCQLSVNYIYQKLKARDVPCGSFKIRFLGRTYDDGAQVSSFN